MVASVLLVGLLFSQPLILVRTPTVSATSTSSTLRFLTATERDLFRGLNEAMALVEHCHIDRDKCYKDLRDFRTANRDAWRFGEDAINSMEVDSEAPWWVPYALIVTGVIAVAVGGIVTYGVCVTLGCGG